MPAGSWWNWCWQRLAAFVWLNTPEDGLLSQIMLNVMISCSVATLFFNANPLMRYDGYYFLADWLEIPNLMNKGRQLVGYYAQKYVPWAQAGICRRM